MWTFNESISASGDPSGSVYSRHGSLNIFQAGPLKAQKTSQLHVGPGPSSDPQASNPLLHQLTTHQPTAGIVQREHNACRWDLAPAFSSTAPGSVLGLPSSETPTGHRELPCQACSGRHPTTLLCPTPHRGAHRPHCQPSEDSFITSAIRQLHTLSPEASHMAPHGSTFPRGSPSLPTEVLLLPL